MAVEMITLRLVGVGPMLMHSSRLADPFDPGARALKKLTRKQHKTDADHHRIAELEFLGSLWLHDGRPCLPPAAIKGALVNGAKTVRKGKATKAAFVAEGPAMLDYDGPKTVEELWKDPRFRHREIVRVGARMPIEPRERARISASWAMHRIWLGSRRAGPRVDRGPQRRKGDAS